MQIIVKRERIIDALSAADKNVGFVPTMGALHQGHISLIERAKELNQLVVVSIFVNPTQFNDKKDFDKYPRTIENDISILEKVLDNEDICFVPEYEEVYSGDLAIDLEFGKLEKIMEGKFREGHFKGVANVVNRLFDIVKPDYAYFGEKDFQQLAIIKKLEKRRGDKIIIIPCPIIRHEDGLAMSSRNTRLSSEQRSSAAQIYIGLIELKNQFLNKLDFNKIKDNFVSFINKDDNLKVEYINIADEENLEPFNVEDSYIYKKYRAFTAVYCGDVRLIDNIELY
jgi:pantoate--beta-alanine ligase